MLLQSETAYFITKCDNLFITKCDSLIYYKVRQLVITKCDSYFITKYDKCYYKVRQVFQSAMVLLQSASEQTVIPIMQPYVNSQDYSSYKMKYTINVKGVCDFSGKFIDDLT